MIKFRQKEYSWISNLFKKKLDLKKLSRAGSYQELKDIARDYLGEPIDEGFGRVVYADGNKVLKIATTDAGLAQNKVEWKTIYLIHHSVNQPLTLNKDYDRYFPEVYDSDPQGKWLLIERFEDFLTLRGPEEIKKWNKYPSILKDLNIKKPDQIDYIIGRIYKTDKVNQNSGFESAISRLKHLGILEDDLSQFGVVIRNNKPQLVFGDLGLDEHTRNVFYWGGRKNQ